MGSSGAQSGQPRNTPVGGLVTFAPRPSSRLLDIVRENQEVNVEEAINISELQQPTSLFFYKAFILLLKLLLFFSHDTAPLLSFGCNSRSFCLSLPSVGTAGVYHHTRDFSQLVRDTKALNTPLRQLLEGKNTEGRQRK